MTLQRTPIFQPARLIPLLIAAAVGLGLWLIPPPQGVDQQGWTLLAIFAFTIVGIVAKALPIGGMGFLSLGLLMTTRTLTLKESLSGFSNPLIWLIVGAFLVARCLIKTGLGMRIAYWFIALFGKRTLSLSYAFAATDLIMAPATPSNTARAGGIIYPIALSLARSFDSNPADGTERRIGSFLIMNVYFINLITSAMFLTAIASNPLIQEIAEQLGYHISWGQWALAASVPGIISFLLIPYVVYKIYPPEIKETPHAKEFAHKHLESMGPMSRYEWITAAVFGLLIGLWIFGDDLAGISPTNTALIGVSILLLAGVLTWEDIKKEYEAWDTLVWFAALITMATYLNKLGVIGWFSGSIEGAVSDLHWMVAGPILLGIYFYSHYAFAGITAHVSSMLGAFLAVGISLGAPPLPFILAMGFTSSLMACLTHYGTGCAPILFGSGYIPLGRWWSIGFIVSIILLIIWVPGGFLWWKVLGLW